MISLMYVTNRPDYAAAAVRAGVDRIFVDLEYIGKEERQKGMDTVKSHHTVADVRAVRKVVQAPAQLLVRVNPLHADSEREIDAVIEAGADAVMLPMWTSAAQAKVFVRMVRARARAILLLETAQAAESLDEVLQINGVDEIFIGLNDLHLCYRQKFMFEPLADGTVERIVGTVKAEGIRCGFGGMVRPGSGMLPAELILSEHCRLGSEIVILSRGFCNAAQFTSEAAIRGQFTAGVAEIRALERVYAGWTPERFEKNRLTVKAQVSEIVSRMG